MDANKMIGMVVGVVIGIIIMSAALFPVIDNAEHTGATKVVNGSVYMHELESETTMVVSPTNTIVVNGETISGYGYPAIVSDVFWLGVNNGGLNIFYCSEGTSNWSAIRGANIALDPSDKTIALTDIVEATSNWNLPEGTTELSFTYDDFCYIRDINGDYAAIAAANISNLKVNAVNDLIGAGYNSNNLVTIYDNVAELGTVAQSGDGFTLTETSDPELFTASTTYTLSWILVKAVVYGESDLSDDMIQMIDAIPIILIASMIMGIAALIISRRE